MAPDENVRIGNGVDIFYARQDERTSALDGEQNGATQTQQDAQQQEAQQEAQQQAQGAQSGADSNAAETDDAGARAYEE